MQDIVILDSYPDYAVTKLGQVLSMKQYAGTSLRELNYELTKNGYLRVTLSHNGVVKREYVHRLVATAFIPNPEGYVCIDHIDRNKTNNIVGNLRWVSYSMNERNKDNKQVICHTLEGDFVRQFSCIQEAADMLTADNVTHNPGCKAHICSCCRGRLEKAYGFRWSYAE